MRLKLIACEVMYREFTAVPEQSPPVVDVGKYGTDDAQFLIKQQSSWAYGLRER